MSTASKEDGTALDNSPTTPARPTDKQMNLLAIIMQNVISKPDINWSNVVLQSGLKNERVAKETYRQMTKKFGWGGSGPGSPSGPAGRSVTPTPTKVQKRTGKVGTKSATKARPTKVKKEEEEEEVENNKVDENDTAGEDDCV